MASALNTARSSIEGRLNTNWTETEIAWPGLEFDPGEDDWIRPTIVMGAGAMEGYGSSGKGTVEGLLLIDVFTLTRYGFGELYAYVDTLRDLFDRATVGTVEFLAASGPRELAPEEVWRGMQFEVPFIITENGPTGFSDGFSIGFA